MDMITALKLIATRSPSAMREAITTIHALSSNSPAAQQRYNFVVDIALNDTAAELSPEERAGIIDNMDATGHQADNYQRANVWLAKDPDQVAWLKAQPGGMSETLRGMIKSAMVVDEVRNK
jgi:hypothetical protein